VDDPAEGDDDDEPEHAEEDGDTVQVPLHHRRRPEGRRDAAAEHVGQPAALALVQEHEQDHHARRDDQDDRERDLHRILLPSVLSWAGEARPGLGAGRAPQRPAACSRYRQMAANWAASMLAPPTRAPSTSFSAMIAAMLSPFTDPPYRIRTLAPASAPAAAVTSCRIAPAISCASPAD